jgi:hypothetical protein
MRHLGICKRHSWFEYQDPKNGMRWKRYNGLQDRTYNLAGGGKIRKKIMNSNNLEL